MFNVYSSIMRFHPIVLEVIYVDKKKMSDKECSSSRNGLEDLPYPFYIPDGGS